MTKINRLNLIFMYSQVLKTFEKFLKLQKTRQFSIES